MAARWDAPVEYVQGWLEVQESTGWDKGTTELSSFSRDYVGSLPLHYAALYSTQPELVKLIHSKSKSAIGKEGGHLWKNPPGQKNLTPLRLADYNTGPAKEAIVLFLKQAEAEYQEEISRAEEAAGRAV